MNNNRTKQLIFTSLCIALGMVLPQFVKIIPIPNAGSVLLPMHIPVLLCGFIAGGTLGAVSGLILPLITFFITGMPPIFPTGISMMLELGTYGVLSGFLFKFTKGKVLPSLIISILGGRIVMGIANTLLFGLSGKWYNFETFITASFITALPGIIIQIILLPVLVNTLKRSKLI